MVIIGPPGSGKSTQARKMAGPETVVIDFDSLAYALGSKVKDHHETPHEASHVTAGFVAWVPLVRAALAGHLGADVVVVHSAPEPWQVNNYRQAGFAIIGTV